MSARSFRPETLAITAGRPEGAGQPLNPPLVTASNFRAGAGREYARGDGTDTVAAFETAIGQLEGGHAAAFGSGMAAASAILDDLPAGAHIIRAEDCYQGVTMALDHGMEHRGWRVSTVAAADLDRWRELIAGGADLVWVESPSNPLLEVADVPAICQAGREAGIPVAVDSTFATPLLQRPLEHGATWSMHSATKFIGGHSDLLAGVLITDDPDRHAALVRRQVLGGAVIGVLEAFLALRGLRTLPVRLAAAQTNAGELARRLDEHPSVTRVRYPGLADHPGHDLAARTLDGFGAVLSFETVGGAEKLDEALTGLEVVVPATSLGGIESTIERRAKLAGQTHLPATLLRLSVGGEHIEDLWEDLDAALGRL